MVHYRPKSPTSAYKTYLYLQAKIGHKANQTRAAKPTASPLLTVQAWGSSSVESGTPSTSEPSRNISLPSLSMADSSPHPFLKISVFFPSDLLAHYRPPSFPFGHLKKIPLLVHGEFVSEFIYSPRSHHFSSLGDGSSRHNPPTDPPTQWVAAAPGSGPAGFVAAFDLSTEFVNVDTWLGRTRLAATIYARLVDVDVVQAPSYHRLVHQEAHLELAVVTLPSSELLRQLDDPLPEEPFLVHLLPALHLWHDHAIACGSSKIIQELNMQRNIKLSPVIIV
ncbi:hypothetical protein BHM03_00031659 [Ensete ventricosum]|nr:hypothetical protein BHM03_00031659 [Ensete ventricosum]